MVVTLVLAGGLAERSLAVPAPEELVPNTVARVAEVPPKHATVTVAELRHGIVLAAAQSGLESPPGSDTDRYERLEQTAIDSLLEVVWLYGETAEMGISVTHREVSRELAQIKRESFRSAAEYREFLRESRYTRRDIRERVEVQMLSQRLQKRLQKRIEREARNELEEQQAWIEFVKRFNEKWRARTVCAPEHATERCSNGPPPTSRL